MVRIEHDVQNIATVSATRRSALLRLPADPVGRGLLLFACFSSVVLMIPMWSAGPLVLDEHGSYWMIDSDLPGSTLERSLTYTAIPPLSGWLQEFSLLVLGKSEVSFRMPSAVCHLLAVPVIYLAGTAIKDGRLGGIAATLLAWHPEALDEVRIARCYGLVLLMASLVIWTTLRWLRFEKKHRWAVGWTLSATGLMWTHYTSALLVILTALCVGICSLRTRRRQRHLTHWVGAMVVLVLLCAPLIPSVLRLREWGPFLNFMSADQSIWSFVGPLWWLGIPLGVITSKLIGVSAVHRKNTIGLQSWTSVVVLTACSLVPLVALAALASGDLSSLANPRYRVAYAPGGACLIAALLSTGSRTGGIILGAVVTIVSAWTISPLHPWQLGRLGSPTDAEWRDANLLLASRAKDRELVFVQSGLAESNLVPVFPRDDVFLEYVACRVSRFYLESSHPRIGLPFRWNATSELESVFRSRLLSESPTVSSFWIVAATDTDLNRASLSGMQQIAADAGFLLQEQQTWPNVYVERYSLPASVAP